MELAQLKMLKAVADEGSIVRAAEQLHCVPSNVTTRIKLLEDELGVALFIRKGRGLVISPAGAIFLNYARQILSLCEEAQQAIAPSAIPEGVLRIGAIESSATARLPSILAEYHQCYPAVQMQFSTGTWHELVNAVAGHELDGAIIAVRAEHPHIEHLPIYSEELILIASPSLGEIRHAQDLASQHMLMWPEGCPYRKKLDHWLGIHDVSVDMTSIASYATILGCVSAGSGVSLVPTGLYEQHKKSDALRGYTFSDLSSVQHYFICNKKIGIHHARDAFAKLLQEKFIQSEGTAILPLM